MKAVAAKLGVKHAETVRGWVRKAEVDAGARPGTTNEESAEPKIGRRCLVPVNALAECLALLAKEAA
jgi:transposase-like protein